MLRSKTTNAAQQNYKRCAAKLQTLRNARSPERRGVSATLKPSHAHQETETRAFRRGFTESARRFSNVNFGDNDAIANLDGGNGLVGSS